MRIGILSDLHLSRAPLPHPRGGADLYVLAGDIGRPAEGIAWARALGKPVLYVPGNHEFYNLALDETVRALKEAAAGSQVRVLDNEEACVGGVRFLGSTLWSDFLLEGDGPAREAVEREAQAQIHDFRRIWLDAAHRTPFSPRDSAALCRRNAAWLREQLARPWAGPTVVITHHAPSARSIEPRFAGSPLNACFASHLDGLVGGRERCLWIHGHMHHSVDYAIAGTRVVSNPRGYWKEGRNENPRFDPEFCVEVA